VNIEKVQDIVGAMVSGNVEAGIRVTYADNGDDNGKLDFHVAGVATFLDLADTPASYVGEATKVVTVNAAQDGLEFVTNVTTDEKVKVDVGAVAGYLGAANNDGVLRTDTSMTYVDGGDFVTLNTIQDIRTTAEPVFKDLSLTDFASGNETITEILDDTLHGDVLDAIVVSDDGVLNISWTAGELWDHTAKDVVDTDLNAGPVALTDHMINYLWWDRSGGGTALTANTTIPDLSDDDVFVAQINCAGGDIHEINEVPIYSMQIPTLIAAFRDIFPSIVTSGLIVSEHAGGGAWDVDQTQGTYYLAAYGKEDIAAQDSTVDQMSRWWQSAAGQSTEVAGQTAIDNAQWNTGNALVGVNAAKWYRSMFFVDDDGINWVYPTAQYNTAAQAIAGADPILPYGLQDHPKVMALVLRGNAAALPASGSNQWIDIRPTLGGTGGGTVTHHDQLANLDWASAGHNINTSVNMEGNTLMGDSGVGGDLNLQSTSDATRGDVISIDNFVIGVGGVGLDYTLTFNGENSDGVLTWMENEDYFLFGDGIVMADGEGISLQEGITWTGATTENLITFPDNTAVALDMQGAVGPISFQRFNTTTDACQMEYFTDEMIWAQGGSDTAINAAIDSGNANGFELKFLPGTSTISGQSVIDVGKTSIRGSGPATFFDATLWQADDIIFAQNLDYLSVENMWITGLKTGTATESILYFNNCDYVKVRDMRLANSARHGVHFVQSDFFVCTFNEFFDCRDYAGRSQGSDFSMYLFNYMHENDSIGVIAQGGGHNLFAFNLSNNDGYGVWVQSNFSCANSNIVFSSAFPSVVVDGDWCTCAGNIADQSSSYSFGISAAIGTTLMGNVSYMASNMGYFLNASRACVAIGNSLYRSGNGQPDFRVGGCTYMVVSTNVCESTAGRAERMANVTDSDYNIFVSNVSFDHDTGSIDFDLNSNHNVVGWNRMELLPTWVVGRNNIIQWEDTANMLVTSNFGQEWRCLDGDGRDNEYVGLFYNLESTNDRSFGLYIQAGSTTVDAALNIYDHDAATHLFMIDGAGNAAIYESAEMRFWDVGSSNYVGFEAPALTGNQIWVLPDADGNLNDVLTTDGGGNLSWTAAVGPHDMLSATHSDSDPAVVSQGSLIVGDSSPEWSELTVGAIGEYLQADGNDTYWDSIQAGDLPAHPHDGETMQFDEINSNGGAFAFTTSGAVSFSQNIIIPDAGNIGSVSDVNAISISATGAVHITHGVNGVALQVGPNAPLEDWHATFDVIELGGNASFAGDDTAGASKHLLISQNAYWDAGNNRWQYQDTDEASTYEQTDGTHAFYVAASGNADDPITWIMGLEITVAGDLVVRDGANIGPDSDKDAMILSSGGMLQLTHDAGGVALQVGLNAPLETWHTSFDVIEIGGNAAIAGDGTAGAGAYLLIAQNAYWDHGDNRWEYQDTDEASLYEQVDGHHTFYVAVSGNADDPITWTTALEITDTGTISGSTILDENDMASDSDVHLATQQSIKAYVDGAGGGDVTAAGNITDHSVVRGDGGAKGIQDSGFKVTDGGALYGGSGGTGTLGGLLDIREWAVNTTADFIGTYFGYKKTAGATAANDDFDALRVVMNIDHNGADHGIIVGGKFQVHIFDGTVTDIIGASYLASLTAATAEADDVTGLQATVTLSGGTVNGDVYGIFIDVSDASAAGSVHMLYLEETFGVDYGIYQNGTAGNYFGGNIGINGTTATYTLNVEGATDTMRLLSSTGACFLRFDNADQNAQGYIEYDADVMELWANATSIMQVSGTTISVGIAGASHASYGLQVHGAALAGGGIYSYSTKAAGTALGVYGRAYGAATTNQGVYASATNATNNHGFEDNFGNYSDNSGGGTWVDGSCTFDKKFWSRLMEPNDIASLYADLGHMRGYFFKAKNEGVIGESKIEKIIDAGGVEVGVPIYDESKAPERFGVILDDEYTPDYLTCTDNSGKITGYSAGRWSQYQMLMMIHQKGLIETGASERAGMQAEINGMVSSMTGYDDRFTIIEAAGDARDQEIQKLKEENAALKERVAILEAA